MVSDCGCYCHGSSYKGIPAVVAAMRPRFGTASESALLSVLASAIMSGYCRFENAGGGSVSYSLINDTFRVRWDDDYLPDGAT